MKYIQYILDGQQRIKNISLKDRDLPISEGVLELHRILTFIGLRRVGKTFSMFQLLKKLMKQWDLELEQIVFIDFTEHIGGRVDFSEILSDFTSLFPDKTPFFVFDEIQEVSDFRHGLIFLFNRGYKIWLSGSNSKLLSSELSTELRWRTYDIMISPLSFSEFCWFREERFTQHLSTEESGRMDAFFLEYLDFWGLPEIVLTEDRYLKQELIKNYLNVILYKDLIERYGINNEYVVKYFIQSCILSVTKEISINKIYRDLKSQNIPISPAVLYNYFEHLQSLFLIRKRYNLFSLKGQTKIFFTDPAFLNIFQKESDLGKRFENSIENLLVRSQKEFYYGKSREGEIDFIIPSEDIAIQVCYILNSSNISREIRSLEKSQYSKKYLLYFSRENIPDHSSIDIIHWRDFFSLYEKSSFTVHK